MRRQLKTPATAATLWGPSVSLCPSPSALRRRSCRARLRALLLCGRNLPFQIRDIVGCDGHQFPTLLAELI
jgi:hypothetical protein